MRKSDIRPKENIGFHIFHSGSLDGEPIVKVRGVHRPEKIVGLNISQRAFLSWARAENEPISKIVLMRWEVHPIALVF